MSMMDQENAPITVGEEQTDNALFLRRDEENASTSLNQKHLISRKLEILVAVNTQDGILLLLIGGSLHMKPPRIPGGHSKK